MSRDGTGFSRVPSRNAVLSFSANATTTTTRRRTTHNGRQETDDASRVVRFSVRGTRVPSRTSRPERARKREHARNVRRRVVRHTETHYTTTTYDLSSCTHNARGQ